ncbi:hypothetical protein PROFUN_14167 [Planoprotostelium fungivorum]|uniref:Uncharacterized protein n=1 Tax=Planoprotostelium fungivorum TaxID=1890364 RepID=A0A2P6N1D2_9EUKA|nr:hypothetical protein PROFUN_14167 [Planoprotostelium fungivorum]
MDQYLSCRDVTDLMLNMLLNGTPKPREHGGPRPTQQQTANLRNVRSVCKTWRDMVDRIFIFQTSHLLLAINKTCCESVRFLLQRTSIDRGKWNAALNLAIKGGSHDIVQSLLENTDYTPQIEHIFRACRKGNVQMFQMVSEVGPPFHTIQRQMWTTCLTKQHKDMLRHLIEHLQLPFNRPDSVGLCRLLPQAVTHNSIDMLEFLLDLSMSHDLIGGHTLALEAASWQGRIDKMKLLLRHPRTDATQHPQCLNTHYGACIELLLEDEKMIPPMLQLFREVAMECMRGGVGSRPIFILPLHVKELAHLKKMRDIIREIDQGKLSLVNERINARIKELKQK